MRTSYGKDQFSHITLDQLIWVVAILGVILFQGLPGPRPLDDSYITYRYARNISTGAGFVYNPGEFVQGTTTPLYTLLLALLAVPFGADTLPNISFGIALIADVINVVLLFRIARHLLKQDLPAFVLALVFLFQPFRINVAVGGMETSLFLTMLLAAYDRYLIGNQVYAAAVLCALAMLIRIDGVLAVGPIFLHALWKNRWAAIRAGLLGALILLPWFLWATWYFGNPIPFSIYAKTLAYQSYTASATLLLILTFVGTGTLGPYQQLFVVFPGLVIALFLIVNGIRWVMKGNQISLVIISYPLLYALVMTIEHAPLFFSWYYVPLMPGLLLLFFGALQVIAPVRTGAQHRLQQGIRLGIPVLGFLLIPAVLMWLLPGWSDTRETERLFHQACDAIPDEASGQLVMAPDIGVIGWRLEKASILDPIGLVSPISVEYMEQKPGPGGINQDLVRDLQPDYVIAREGFIKDLIEDASFITDYNLVWHNETSPIVKQKVVVYKRNTE